MRADCPLEAEVLDHLQTRTWPARDAELQAHVTGCLACRDLVAVATALLDDREEIGREIAVPRAQLVWWRAQVRARQEAARAAARPVALTTGAAALAILLVVTLAITSGWRWVAGRLGSIADRFPGASANWLPDAAAVDFQAVAAYATPERLLSPLVAVTATLALLVAAISVYVMLFDD